MFSLALVLLVYRLDLRTMTWELLQCEGEPPIYRDFHSATAIGDCMYIFGGRSDLSGGLPGQILGAEFYTNKLHYLDTRTLTWHSPVVSPSPQAVAAAEAAAAAGAAGGMPHFPPPADRETVLPEGRRSHSAINLDGNLLIFGGYNGRRDRHFNDMWILEPAPK